MPNYLRPDFELGKEKGVICWIRNMLLSLAGRIERQKEIRD